MEMEPDKSESTSTSNLDFLSSCSSDAAENKVSKTKIRHLVLSGGGQVGISFFGALQASSEAGFWNIDDIETVYATSAGSLFGTVTALTKFVSWESLDTFFRKRPWEDVFNVSVDKVLNSFTNCGILGRRTAVEFLRPVLCAADLSVETTMLEFYEHTGIEMHYMVTNMDKFELVDVSHLTHPNWKVVDAVYASSALPILFQPIRIEDTMYADGAILCNFPIAQCLARCAEKAESPDTIFAFQKINTGDDDENENGDNKECEVAGPPPNLLNYLGGILSKLLYSVSKENDYIAGIRHLIKFPSFYTNAYDIYRSAADYEFRKKLREEGIEQWNAFYEKYSAGM